MLRVGNSYIIISNDSDRWYQNIQVYRTKGR
jgi:hypothetical protein